MSEREPPQQDPTPPDEAASEFARQAGEDAPGLVREFIDFLRHNKKWWLLPIILVLLVVGLLVVLGGTALGPFLYPLF
ncbi:MAG: DUF5989 family protein [Planctomycetota bacterium]|jgi:hypothetical protein